MLGKARQGADYLLDNHLKAIWLFIDEVNNPTKHWRTRGFFFFFWF